MSKASFYPGWIVPVKNAHTHSAADQDRPSPADVTATTTVTFDHHTNLSLFSEACTKLDSEFACDQCTLGLQMDREGEKGTPVFLHTCLGKLGNSWLLYQL
jgi:hypothetical protein